jgi:hypothetical protein
MHPILLLLLLLWLVLLLLLQGYEALLSQAEL